MASTVSQNTFLSTYNDDYRDSDHYHRILFNNGRSLQARELTQMQTIIQAELARLASYVFKEGAIFDTNYGALSSGVQALGYVKVLTLPTGYDLLVGEKLTNPDGVTALVKAVIPATSTDPATILVRYISSNNETSNDPTTAPKVFGPSDVLSYDTGDISGSVTVQTTNTAANPAVGKGTFIEIPQFNTFVNGHLVMAEAQSLVISKYSARPTAVIGFKVTEEVITATDNLALYDNSGSTPNLTAPGADRYRITCTLSLESNVGATDTFHPLVQLTRGFVTALKTRDNILNGLGRTIAGRTADVSGDFIVNDARQGRFDLEVADDSDSNYLQLKMTGGIAFVSGNRIERERQIPTIRIQKPRTNPDDLETKNNEFIPATYGNYFLTTNLKGLVSAISDYSTVNLYNSTRDADGGLATDLSPRSTNLQQVGTEYAYYASLSETQIQTLKDNNAQYGAVKNTPPYSAVRFYSWWDSQFDGAGITDFNKDGIVDGVDVQLFYGYYLDRDSDKLYPNVVDSADSLIAAARIKKWLSDSRFDPYYTADPIGTARIRNIDEYDNQFRVHVFDVLMDSDGNGYKYGVKDVRSIGTSSSNYANLATVGGKYDLQDRFSNNLLFPLPRNRVQETTNLVMTVGKVYTDTTTTGGTATFSTGSSNIFTDPEQWIVAVDSSGDVFSPPTVSGTPNTSATVTGLPTSSAVTLFGYETKTAVRKTKTLQTNQTQQVSLTNRQFKLSVADIYKFSSVVDDTTSEDITYKFNFDNGQRDNFYTVGSGTLKSGVTAPAGTVTVTFDYFTHNAGDFFGGKASYPDLEYDRVPSYTTNTGIKYQLTDVIDMRPIKNNTGTGFTGTGAVYNSVPRNGDIITIGTAKYWQPRIDVLTLSSNGTIVYTAGDTNFEFKDPEWPQEHMPLWKLALAPYTFDKTEVIASRYNNRGYKMSDIRRIDDRLSTVEALTAFTLSEIRTQQLTVEDPYDASIDRLKTGITGDTFANNNQSDVLDEDYRALLVSTKNLLSPLEFNRQVPLTYDSDLSLGTVRKQTTVWPKYTEEVYIDQGVASKPININSFDIGVHVGTGIVEPAVNTWTVRKKVDPETQEEVTTADQSAIASQGSQEQITQVGQPYDPNYYKGYYGNVEYWTAWNYWASVWGP